MVEKQLEPMQCRMARAALDWTALELAEQAGVGVTTVVRFEGGQTTPTRATLAVLERAFEAAGIQFIPENGGGPGVRLRARLTPA